MKNWTVLKQLIAATFFCNIIWCCNSTGKLTRRYNSVAYHSYADDSIKYSVKVNGFVFEPDAPKPSQPKTVFDLSPQGQKALVKVLGIKESKSDDFLGKLSKTLATTKKDAANVVDYTKFTKRLVFSIRNISPYPADRIAKINIRLNVTDPHIKIISFDKIITKYESVDVGKLDFSNTTNLGISANAGAGAATDTSTTTASIPAQTGFGYGINANASNSRTFAEEVMLKQRYISLS